MAVGIEDIKKLRALTGAGLSDCKNALAEAEGNLDAAVELIRKRGQAIAAKRSDREAAEGCVLVKIDGNFGAILALKCETDFVAKNADFVALTNEILDAAVAARCKTIEEVQALTIGGRTVAERITDQSGITGEKMELDGYQVVEGEALAAYNHQNNNVLCTLVALSSKVEDETVGRNIAMQVASASPVAIDADSVPQETKDTEFKVAVEKTKVEQVQKAVEAALKKAGVNLYIAESEEHLEEGVRKGNITEEQAEEIRQLKASVAAEKEANLNEGMIENIAKGRLGKFFKEVCLLEQEFIWDKAQTVAQYLNSVEKGLTVTAFKRFTLRAE
ncbi:MAG: translation elongation factor Ts [Bacteroidales bacterium]|nr:translation elongation factor Ts [Bacteroidales bacterium]